MSIDALPRVAARDVPIATAAQMADADRIASEELGIPLETLMRNAARQVAAATRALLGSVDGETIAALAGSGNNGGDAVCALLYLQSQGAAVDAFVAAPAAALRPLARMQCDLLEASGAPRYDTVAHSDVFLRHRLRSRSVILDGLLGNSARGAPRGEIGRLIRIANATSPTPIVAVDLPSGLDPDSGMPLGGPDTVVRAALTVTLALPRRGLIESAARDYVGDLVLADIGMPVEALKRVGIDASGVFALGDLLRVVS